MNFIAPDLKVNYWNMVRPNDNIGEMVLELL